MKSVHKNAIYEYEMVTHHPPPAPLRLPLPCFNRAGSREQLEFDMKLLSQ